METPRVWALPWCAGRRGCNAMAKVDRSSPVWHQQLHEHCRFAPLHNASLRFCRPRAPARWLAYPARLAVMNGLELTVRQVTERASVCAARSFCMPFSWHSVNHSKRPTSSPLAIFAARVLWQPAAGLPAGRPSAVLPLPPRLQRFIPTTLSPRQASAPSLGLPSACCSPLSPQWIPQLREALAHDDAARVQLVAQISSGPQVGSVRRAPCPPCTVTLVPAALVSFRPALCPDGFALFTRLSASLSPLLLLSRPNTPTAAGGGSPRGSHLHMPQLSDPRRANLAEQPQPPDAVARPRRCAATAGVRARAIEGPGACGHGTALTQHRQQISDRA